MCLNPINIINNSKRFDPSKDRLRLLVPCGKCEECKSSIREDWFVRTFFEWQQHPNSTYFYTLTYNDENLPLYNGFRCFDKRGVQLFLKRLRKDLAKFNISVKYLITCEYGELFKRPHYHALFFFSQPMNVFALKRIIEKNWQHGFCVPGDNGGLVNSSKGLKYVTKYITKDDSFVEKYEITFVRFLIRKWYRKYLSSVSSPIRPRPDARRSRRLNFPTFDAQPWEIPTDIAIFNNFFQAGLREYQQMMPFHLQSTNLGISAERSIYSIHQLKVNIVGDGLKNIPRFLRRKLWMDKYPNMLDGNMTGFVKSDVGREHELASFEVVRDERQAKNYDSFNYFISLTKDDELLELLNIYRYRSRSQVDLEYLRALVKLFVNNEDEQQLLALYMQFYRGRMCLYDDDISKVNFLLNQRLIYVRHLYAVSMLDFKHLASYYKVKFKDFDALPYIDCGDFFTLKFKEHGDSYSSFYDLMSSYLWDNHSVFMNCEQAATLLDSIEIYQRKLIMTDRKQKNDAQRRLRQRYKKLKLFNP